MWNWRYGPGTERRGLRWRRRLWKKLHNMKIETSGTDKITQERGRERKDSLQETCVFRGSKDEDPEKRIVKQQSQVQLAGRADWD